MKKLTVLFLLVFFVSPDFNITGAQNVSPASLKKVSAREVNIVMPTSREGFPDPSTPFLEAGGRDEDFCYPVQFKSNVIREKPIDIEWRIIILENEFIRVEFAPELGGMIWRLFDKVHGQDVLHAPGKVSPTADGFGGSYTPGGLEWNYPYAHSVTNTWPRKTEFRENKDGSATYIISEWERNGRTQWAMEFTLMPGESRLKQRVILYNRGKLPASFVYWGNARVPADGNTRWIEPEAMASEHGGSNIFTWPVFRGVDLSMMINDPEVIGMYFLEPRYNFFGLTNLKTKSGMVHYADRHEVPGKKLWNWGRTPMDGNRKWDPANESGSEPHMYGYEYGEVQSGRMVNQDHLEWLLPEECLIWHEQWSPIFGLSNVTEVSEDAAFQLDTSNKKLYAYPFTGARDVRLSLMVSGRQVKELLLDGKPSQLQEFDLGGIVKGNINDLEIRIIRGKEETGTISSVSRCIQKKASELREVPVFKEHSSESMTSWAEFEHKLLYRQRAMDLYEKAITLDSLNFRAHLGLGKLLFAHGDFRDAAKHFEKAIQAYKYDGEAYLMLAHIDHLAGNLSSASERAYDAVYFGEKCRGNLKLGELFIAKGEYGKAKNYLEEALVNNSRSLRAYALLALCDRKSGNIKLAQADLARTPSLPLKDMLWYSEAYLSGLINAQQMNAELFNDEWRYIEIGLDYLSLAAYKEADGMADAGVALHTQGWKLDKLFDPERMYGFMRKRENPFFYVIKGMAYQGMGESEKAADLFKKGDYFEYHVNFNQPELVPAMQAAIRAGNRFADYWLGNFLYHSLRPDEAYGHWKKASDKYPQHPQILRNLGLYSEFQNRDPETSISLFGKALEQNSNDLFMRLDLVTALRNNNAPPDEILKVYLAAPKEQRDTYLYQHGLLQAFKDAGKWSEAAEYLATVDRKWSDDVKSWYYFCIGYADYLVDHSKPKEALEWINKSSTVPANLSNVSLPVEYWYRQKEYYIAGLAFRMLGQEVQSREFFTRAINEQTDFLFNASSERGLQLQRFYAALSMKELGMDPSARSILNGINTYRIQHGLIVLKLEKKELMNWSVRDPLAENPSSDEH